MANTFDTYYDIQPYRSFRDLDRNEGFPGYGLDEDIPDEFLEDSTENVLDFPSFYEDYPPVF